MFRDRSVGMSVLFVLTVCILAGRLVAWVVALPLWAYLPLVLLGGLVLWKWAEIRYFFTGKRPDPKPWEREVSDHQRPIEPVRLYDWSDDDD